MSWQVAVCGDVAVSFFVAGALFGDVAASCFVADALDTGDFAVSLFVAAQRFAFTPDHSVLDVLCIPDLCKAYKTLWSECFWCKTLLVQKLFAKMSYYRMFLV